MRPYLQSKLVVTGLVLLVLGSGPLWGIVLAAKLGFYHDPNPNPIGPGMLFACTFWPAIICLIIGIVRVRRRGQGSA